MAGRRYVVCGARLACCLRPYSRAHLLTSWLAGLTSFCMSTKDSPSANLAICIASRCSKPEPSMSACEPTACSSRAHASPRAGCTCSVHMRVGMRVRVRVCMLCVCMCVCVCVRVRVCVRLALTEWLPVIVARGCVRRADSGGRKVIAPGIAHAETITTFHSARFMEDPKAIEGNLVGNPLHE